MIGTKTFDALELRKNRIGWNAFNRWYAPEVGRWISEDPIGFEAGDANLYRYVGNEVTGATDPSGLAKYNIVAKITDVKLRVYYSYGLNRDEYVEIASIFNELNKKVRGKFQDQVIERIRRLVVDKIRKIGLSTIVDAIQEVSDTAKKLGKQKVGAENLLFEAFSIRPVYVVDYEATCIDGADRGDVIKGTADLVGRPIAGYREQLNFDNPLDRQRLLGAIRREMINAANSVDPRRMQGEAKRLLTKHLSDQIGPNTYRITEFDGLGN